MSTLTASRTAVRRDHARSAGAMRTGLLLSAIVHSSVVVGAVMWGLRHDVPRPPVYRVELIGAPTGARRAGVVAPKATEAPSAAEAPSGAERAPTEKALPSKKAPAPSAKATPLPTKSKAAGTKAATPAAKAAAPPAAGSKEGGKGADVRNVRVEGITFPFPVYLNNIMRQLSLAYSPRPSSAALVAEIKFMIRRDGSVSGIEVVKSSGNRLFDLEAAGTVESVGATRSFGPLPSGWADDVLIVYFTFDYALRP